MLKSLAIAICSLGLATAAVAQSSTTSPSTSSPSASPSTTAPSTGSSSSSSGMTTGSTTKSAADCDASWKTADKNNDGKLDQTEMNSSKSSLPTSLQSASSVTQSQFMTACQGK